MIIVSLDLCGRNDHSAGGSNHKRLVVCNDEVLLIGVELDAEKQIVQCYFISADGCSVV